MSSGLLERVRESRTWRPVMAAVLLGVFGVVASSCTADDGPLSTAPVGILAPGFRVTVLVEDLHQPTQIAWGPKRQLLIAQLNGGENDKLGQVVEVNLDSGERRVLVDGLDKPTGVAWFDDQIWVMERRSLSKGSPGDERLEPVLVGLPFNGRSEGTLTPTVDGRLLYETSGRLEGASVAAGSGGLFALDANAVSTPIATGLKNAYGHTVASDGRIWATEISDGDFDGVPAYDELVLIQNSADHGWPWCVGDNREVAEFTQAAGEAVLECSSLPRPVALFEPGATPTSVVQAPWDTDTLIVSLWNRGKIVEVPMSGGPLEPGQPSILEGVAHPQHLLVDGQSLLVVDFDGGRILKLEGMPDR